MASATLKYAIFPEEPTIVIKQGHSTKTVKNGWRNDQAGKSDLHIDTTTKCLVFRDQCGEDQEAGADAGPRAKSLSNSFTKIQDKSEGLRLNVTVTY